MTDNSRKKRQSRMRHRIAGTADRPRLVVARSNVHIYAQLVDDRKGKVMAGASSLSPALRDKRLKRMEVAREVGKLVAEKAKALGVARVVFDRAGYRYHGRVRALATGAREGGLDF